MIKTVGQLAMRQGQIQQGLAKHLFKSAAKAAMKRKGENASC